MKTLSLDLRERAISSYDTGYSAEEVADQFSISVSSIRRWLRRRRQTGNLAPLPPPGRPRILDASAAILLQEWLEAENDLTLGQLRQRFSEHGYHVGTTAVFELLRRTGISRKKNDACHRTGTSRRPRATHHLGQRV